MRNYIYFVANIENDTLLLPAACVGPDSFSCSGLFAVGNEGGIHLRKQVYYFVSYYDNESPHPLWQSTIFSKVDLHDDSQMFTETENNEYCTFHYQLS